MEEQNNKEQEQIKVKNQEEKFLENSGLEHYKEQATIMPTMIDDSMDDKEIKRDISAIVPKFESIENKEGTELTSKDAVLKSDGAITIATINDIGEATLKDNFVLPEQIDIKARKEEQIKAKTKKKKKEKIKPSKAAKKQQNIVSLGALIVIIFLVLFYKFVIDVPGEEDFVVLEVRVELGDKLPIRTSSYVRPGVGEKVDELLYIKDTSKVILEEVGEYEFSIKHNGITKYGTVIVEDTTSPELITRDVTIVADAEYNASLFVESCRDFSGCNYSFQDEDVTKKYTNPGSYILYIIATDAYGNSVTKKANLFIESKGNTKTFVKETGFDFNTGYSLKEEYSLNFADYANDTLLFSGIFRKTMTYEDEEKYQAARKTYNGEPNYQCLDHEKQIIYSKSVTTVGNNYTALEDVQSYLAREGFEEK